MDTIVQPYNPTLYPSRFVFISSAIVDWNGFIWMQQREEVVEEAEEVIT